jgi:hypothetical protein
MLTSVTFATAGANNFFETSGGNRAAVFPDRYLRRTLNSTKKYTWGSLGARPLGGIVQ